MSATDLTHEAMPFTALFGIERVSTADDEVRDADGKLVARVTQTQAVLQP